MKEKGERMNSRKMGKKENKEEVNALFEDLYIL